MAQTAIYKASLFNADGRMSRMYPGCTLSYLIENDISETFEYALGDGSLEFKVGDLLEYAGLDLDYLSNHEIKGNREYKITDDITIVTERIGSLSSKELVEKKDVVFRVEILEMDKRRIKVKRSISSLCVGFAALEEEVKRMSSEFKCDARKIIEDIRKKNIDLLYNKEIREKGRCVFIGIDRIKRN